MANSLRDTIRAQASSGLIVWLPALLGWLLLYWGATNMASPAAQLAMPMSDWSAANWAAVFIMWAVMMAAMMLPTAQPMVSVFGSLNRARGEAARTTAFVAGYLALLLAPGQTVQDGCCICDVDLAKALRQMDANDLRAAIHDPSYHFYVKFTADVKGSPMDAEATQEIQVIR